MPRRTPQGLAALGLASMLLCGGAAHAQDVALPEPVAEPAQGQKNAAGEPEIALDVDREIDLANVVTSAAKGVTTVQEAPSIVTILTAEEMKARGYQTVEQALASVPGWMDAYFVGNQVNLPVVRGIQQAVLTLHDGISLFEPWANITNLDRSLPIENLKRVEVVTGPGGVLWGANSFLGVVNMITKDAEDVNGLEVSAGYGDGPGNKEDFKAYALFGKTFFHGKLKIFQHVSYENYIGTVQNIPQFVASSPAPQFTGLAFYGANQPVDPARSWVVNIDGKYSLGPVSLYYSIPFGDMHPNMVFANAVQVNERVNKYDRYAILEYKDRFWKDRFGLTAKGYWTQFVRGFDIQLFRPSNIFPPFVGPDGKNQIGGLHFSFANQFIQRTGATVDMDLNLKYGFRVLLGGEAFYESITGSTDSFPEQPYGAAPMGSPTASPAALPLICPQMQNPDGTFTPVPKCPRQFVNDIYRVVGALYADLQYRPIAKLTLDGGVRVQEGFGGRPFDLIPLYSAALVWNFLPDYHFKANYTTGFRPTVYQNTDETPGGVNYGSNPNLESEQSQSFQGEINARLLRNTRKVRELELRVDYSYTFLDKLIQIHGGTYYNTGQRAIHSVEGYAKLYLNGDHFLQASYTYLYSTASDVGVVRNMPNNWIALGASFNIIKRTLDLNANLMVTGAYQDPNRVITEQKPGFGTATGARTSDLTWDRLTPVALLQLGFRLRFLKEKLGVSGQFYNVLNQRYWSPDGFYDITPSVEMTPTPAPGFSFFAQVSYHP